MKGKIGSVDAAIRTVAGLLIILVGHHLRSWWGFAGLVPLATAIIGFCPLYWLIRIDTLGRDERDAPQGPPGDRLAHG